MSDLSFRWEIMMANCKLLMRRLLTSNESPVSFSCRELLRWGIDGRIPLEELFLSKQAQ
jgi:hypothetical protein